jgi:hypothetical protein
MAPTYNPSYLGDRDQEDYGLSPALENSFQEPILKIPNTVYCHTTLNAPDLV